MDIKTRLEDDKVLFADFQSNYSIVNILMALNKNGIFTVEDLINADTSIFSIPSRKMYNAMAHVFRNAYLNQDLVYDVLFQKEYETEKLASPREKELYNDLLSLGLIRCTNKDFKNIIAPKLLLREYPTVTIEFLLREKGLNAKGPNLRKFYLDYIDKKKELEQQNNNQINLETNINENDSSTLTSLKIQLQNLNSMKQELDKQIDTLQSKITTLEGGSLNHGRK